MCKGKMSHISRNLRSVALILVFCLALCTEPRPTLNFQGGKSLGRGDLISILSDICGFGDDDDEASFSTVNLTQDVVAEVKWLAVFQPLAFHRRVCNFTLEH